MIKNIIIGVLALVSAITIGYNLNNKPEAPASENCIVYGVSNYVAKADHIIVLGNKIGVSGTNYLFATGGWDNLPVIFTPISKSEYKTLAEVLNRAADDFNIRVKKVRENKEFRARTNMSPKVNVPVAPTTNSSSTNAP